MLEPVDLNTLCKALSSLYKDLGKDLIIDIHYRQQPAGSFL